MSTSPRLIGGTLVPSHFVSDGLRTSYAGRLGEKDRDLAARRFTRWWRRAEATIGPATSVRTIAESCVAPLFALLGYRLAQPVIERGRADGLATSAAGSTWPVVVVSWADDLDRSWRDAVCAGRLAGAAWSFVFNVRELRIVDNQRPWGRRHLAFDMRLCAAEPAAFDLLWALARAGALDSPRRDSRTAFSFLQEIVQDADNTARRVCAGLETGVREAVAQLATALATCSARDTGRPGPDTLLDSSLTVVYRLLFLLFAEARLLVPTWHPTYREAYSVETLRDSILSDAHAEVGLWTAVQAISRLAHRGCRVGSLKVTAFNGHLFSPERAALLERATIGDVVLRQVLGSLSTVARGRRRVCIAFSDLGVEQLGAIYERILDHRLDVREARAGGTGGARPGVTATLVAGRGSRKATATYYTPRSLTDLIVRRTLAPLVRDRSTTGILGLRVLDPAMGSGAFLVATCAYLSHAYEVAHVREQRLRDHELSSTDRAEIRRTIARRCLYGVDRNPMAVQLAQLSLWLATLAADVPLTFLDHHFRVGDSLVGASLNDLLRQSPGRPGRRHGDDLPLLRASDAMHAMDETLAMRDQLADLPDDSLEQVRHKERLLATLQARGAPLARWRRAADLWCAPSFWREVTSRPVGAVYRELLSATLGRGAALAARHLVPQLEAVGETAARERFFHWEFEFPEVFASRCDSQRGGFDAIVGNPPWDMVREDEAADVNGGRAKPLAAFVRDSRIYSGASDAHANLYLLFVDRARQLLRPGGRLGLVVPWGLAGDHGAATVRRTLLDDCELDTFFAVDNRRALFPIHRSLRFLVFTGTRGTRTGAVHLTRLPGTAAALDACPQTDGARGGAGAVVLTRELLGLTSGPSLAVPDVRSQDEVSLLDRLWRAAPALGTRDGWGVKFGRELNATDDRHLLQARSGLRVLEGKHLEPFRPHPEMSARFATAADVRRKLGHACDRARVAYRDVASATNELTLIAGVIPPGVVTTHTLFCCRTSLPRDHQHLLCALLNSLVANWMVRRWVSSHVTVALVERLPVPPPPCLAPWLDVLASSAKALAGTLSAPARRGIEARAHAVAARAWGLTAGEVEIVLRDFPLLEKALIDAVREEFARLVGQPSSALTGRPAPR